MKQLIIAFLLFTGLAFGQVRFEKTITFLDSVTVTDSIQIPKGSYPTSLRIGDTNKITEFEFDYKLGTTWYTIFTADSNYAIKVADNVIVGIQTEPFKSLWAKTWNDEPIYMRLDPNDSDTTTRSVIITFEGK